MNEEWIIFLEEVLPEYGIEITSDKIELLAKDIMLQISCLQDIDFAMRGGMSAESKIDYKKECEILKDELNLYKRRENVFIRTVARRHNVDLSDVYIEDDKVMVRK